MFKCYGARLIGESDSGFNFPWLELGAVRDSARIVFSQPFAEVGGAAGIKTFRVRPALENINVGKLHFSELFAVPACRAEAQGEV